MGQMTAKLERPVTAANAHMSASRLELNGRLTIDWSSALVQKVKVHRVRFSPSFQLAAWSLLFSKSGLGKLWDVVSLCVEF